MSCQGRRSRYRHEDPHLARVGTADPHQRLRRPGCTPPRSPPAHHTKGRRSVSARCRRQRRPGGEITRASAGHAGLRRREPYVSPVGPTARASGADVNGDGNSPGDQCGTPVGTLGHRRELQIRRDQEPDRQRTRWGSGRLPVPRCSPPPEACAAPTRHCRPVSRKSLPERIARTVEVTHGEQDRRPGGGRRGRADGGTGDATRAHRRPRHPPTSPDTITRDGNCRQHDPTRHECMT